MNELLRLRPQSERRMIASTGLAVIVGALLLVPWRPLELSSGLDASWHWVLHENFANGRVFGRDFVFTFGPLGFLYTKAFHPATAAYLWTAWSAFVVIWTVVLWRHLQRTLRTPFARIGTFLVLVVLSGVSYGDAFFLAIPVFAASVDADDQPAARFDAALLWGLAAAASLIKFSFCMVALGSVTVIIARDVARRRWPLAAFVYFVSVPVIWLAVGQPLEALPAFFRNSLDIARGYTEAMANSTRDPLAIVEAAVAFAPFVLIAGLVAYRRRDPGIAALLATVCGSLIIAAKAAFARYDAAHEIIAAAFIPCALGLAWLPFWHLTRRRVVRLAALASLAVGVHTSGLILRRSGESSLATLLIHVPFRLYQSLGAILSLPQGHARELQYAARTKAVAAEHPLPAIRGGVDVYPAELSVVLSHGFEYAPRPIPQSYSAYTARLAEMNASHLRGKSSPENILLTVESIDGRLPSMDDGASWPEIWRRYAVVADTGGYLWLRRREHPADSSVATLITEHPVRFDEPFELPDATCGALMMRTRFAPTLLYRLKAALWKAPVMIVRFDDDRTEWRIVPAIAEAGVVISPLITTRRQFAEFMSSDPARARVSDGRHTARIAVLTTHPDRYFARDFQIAFYSTGSSHGCR